MGTKFLCYEDFGAKGDGVTDDIEAIIACHEEANKTGTPVKTNDGAIYYIGGRALTVSIKTDVDFGKSKFIIDDRTLEKNSACVFSIPSDYKEYNIDITSLNRGQTKLDIPHEGDNLYVRVQNANHNIYIRYGCNANSGTPIEECFAVDKDGNISPSVDWDFSDITKAYAKCTDDKPITIRGGIFTTIANKAPSKSVYHARGFHITRSHVTVENITHYVTGEEEHGAPYSGFVSVCNSVDFVMKNSTFTPHRTYRREGNLVPMGSYDIQFAWSLDLKLININQTIDICDDKYWGLFTSDFCKNISFENCEMSRFDAHQGVTNLNIKGCKFGYQAMNLIGFGEAVIEDSEITASRFISLRWDYGCFFNGNITIKNCKWHPMGDRLDFIDAYRFPDHDFGYTCMMAQNITIDGLYIYDKGVTEESIHILPPYTKELKKDKLNFYGIPKTVTLKNIKTESGKEYRIFAVPSIYEGVTVITD